MQQTCVDFVSNSITYISEVKRMKFNFKIFSCNVCAHVCAFVRLCVPICAESYGNWFGKTQSDRQTDNQSASRGRERKALRLGLRRWTQMHLLCSFVLYLYIYVSVAGDYCHIKAKHCVNKTHFVYTVIKIPNFVYVHECLCMVMFTRAFWVLTFFSLLFYYICICW